MCSRKDRASLKSEDELHNSSKNIWGSNLRTICVVEHPKHNPWQWVLISWRMRWRNYSWQIVL